MNRKRLERRLVSLRGDYLIPLIAVAAVFTAAPAQAQEPNISERFPIRGRANLSPPIVVPPIHECARFVSVAGFVPKALVQVFANGSELIGTDKPKHSPAKIKLTRPLVLGDSITATQTIGLVPSDPSYDAVTVDSYPALTTPVEVPKVYSCGRVVPVANLIASTHVVISDVTLSPPAAIGASDTTGDWNPVVTSPLVADHQLTAQQIACPAIPAKTAKSLPSAKLSVTTAPNPPPKVTNDVPVVGSEQVVLHGLLVGAEIELRYGATPIPDGLATATDNIADVPPVPPSTPITAVQRLCTTSAPSAPVTATTTPVTPILGSPICPGSRYVTVDNTMPGLNVVLLRGGSVIGYVGGELGTVKLAVGAGVTLGDGDVLTVVQYVSSSFGTFFSNPSNAVTIGCGGGSDVITQHNDNRRTGAYTAETTLTPAAVLARGMREKWRHPVKGWVNAQPLYVRNVAFRRGTANAVFIATVFANKVYALNAETGDEQWSVTLEDSDTAARGLAMGIDSTPVIDVATQRIYLAFSTKNQVADMADLPDSTKPGKDGKAYTYQDTDLKNLDTAFWIVALDYRTGQEVARAFVNASLYRGNGQKVSFEAPFHRQHPALLLDHGALYVAFGSIAGSEGFLEYHGWVMAYRAHNLSFQSAFNTSKNYAPPRAPYQFNSPDDAAGIWQGGGGLTADRDGNVFFLVGNGTADPASGKYGDSFVKLTPTGSALVPTAFVPSNAANMTANDADFGAGGALAIPGTDFVVGGGKPGFMYLLDRRTMKRRQEFAASTNQFAPAKRDDTWNQGPHLHGSPTYWRGPDERSGNLYVWGEKDFLRRYRFDIGTGLFNTASDKGTVLALEDWHAMPGGMISLSANGNRGGTGIVWASLPASAANPHPGRLYAFNAETLQPLWDTAFPSMGHWLPPTIADGKVFIGTSSDMVICYELGPERNNPNPSWTPFQPKARSMTMTRPSGRRWDEAPMTTLPANTLKRLAPPPDALRYAVLEGEGTSRFTARKVSATKFAWVPYDTELEVAIADAGDGAPAKPPLRLTISPDNTWRMSDGSEADVSLILSYTAPDNEGASWALYKVERSSGDGVLRGVTYIQRVMTHGGMPPAPRPTSAAATARSALEARYILFKKHGE
jgi:outer membrane protein assembly factor BamB